MVEMFGLKKPLPTTRIDKEKIISQL